MEDKSESKAFESALTCLNSTPRGAFEKESPGGEANDDR
jgi:hypothetical protein